MVLKTQKELLRQSNLIFRVSFRIFLTSCLEVRVEGRRFIKTSCFICQVDLPLSYGIAEVKQESTNLSTVNFSWDPTRETGVFIKVHCISTEFTPKKHGGEKGVPFRLQVSQFVSS